MAGRGLNYAGEYNLEVCSIASTSGEIVDVKDMFAGVNIFEDIFRASLTGDIALVDTNNLLTNLPIIGQEKLLLRISTPSDGPANRTTTIDFTTTPLYIYKVDAKTNVNDNTIAYSLSFTTPEAIRSNRIRVSQAFEGEPSVDMVQKMLRDEELLNSKKEYYYELTSNNYKFVSPQMRPFDFIQAISRRCMAADYNFAPTFLFYETCKGFFFRTLDGMMDRKNPRIVFKEDTPNVDLPNPKNALHNIINYSVIGSTDVMMNMRKGMYASNLLMIDLVNKTVENFNYNYFESFEEGEKKDVHVDEYNAYASSQAPVASKAFDDFQNTLADYDMSTMYMQAVDRDSPGGLFSPRHTGQFDYTGTDNWLQRRRGRFTALDSALTLKLTVNGQTHLAAGDMIGVNLKNKTSGARDGGGILDEYYSGKYLVRKLRHQFTRGQGQPKHLCHLEVVRDTLRKPYPINGVSVFDSGLPINELIPLGEEDPSPVSY